MARLVINPRLDNNRDSLFKSIQISKDPNHEMDLQVRLAELSVTGSLRSTKKLAQHRGPAHKMTLLPDSPYIVLSAGEDGQVLTWHWSWSITFSLQVLSIDIREPKPDKILLLRNEKDKKVCMAMNKS